ncbi:MAG: hypothetical protein KKA73_12710 [Chloroflexi bacterium]|nr:hypothetical protein [Chloroflexota bacterium]MBU1748541.1 hypothetical protein [Chloroflexota bacterium]
MSQVVSAESLRDFISGQRSRIGAAYQEVEQIQAEYQGAYTRFKAEHDPALQALADTVEARGDVVDAALRAQIDEWVPVERQSLVDRIAKLDEETKDLRRQADAKIEYVQQQVVELHKLNPQLDEQEESLKSDVASRKAELDDLNARVKELGRGLGFITRAGRIHALDRERHRVLGQLQVLGTELSKTRQQWRNRQDALTTLQTDSRAEWETMTAQIGQLEQEHDYLAQNIETLARRNAIVFLLDNLKEPTTVSDPALTVQLQDMIALNIHTDDFQVALGSVAGILGLLKGVDEGLGRFLESVRVLISEQDRHSEYLPPLRIELADSVLAFGGTWDELAEKARDEQALADRPAEFVVAMKPFLDEQLTEERIKGFFDTLGRAIQQATASWR